jgi:hypothetical protein
MASLGVNPHTISLVMDHIGATQGTVTGVVYGSSCDLQQPGAETRRGLLISTGDTAGASSRWRLDTRILSHADQVHRRHGRRTVQNQSRKPGPIQICDDLSAG